MIYVFLLGRQFAAGQAGGFQIVTTGEELQRAVFDGVKHIVISRHLNMVQDPLWDLKYGSVAPTVPEKGLLSVKNGTQTITGNCTEPFPEALNPPPSTDTQCVVTVFEDFMDNDETVWMSNLYLRLDGLRSRAVGPTETVVKFDTSVFFVQYADMYLTNVIMRGLSDVGYEGRAIDMMDPPSWNLPGSARLYARDCQFLNFMESQGSALRLQSGNRATLKRCRFYDNYILPGSTNPEDAGPAIAAVSKPHNGTINPVYRPAGVWLHSCEFRNNTPGRLGPVAVNSSSVFSNMQAPEVVDIATGTVSQPMWLRPRSPDAAVAAAVWNSSAYLTEADPWFAAAVASFEDATGSKVPEFEFDLLSLDVSASSPPLGRPIAHETPATAPPATPSAVTPFQATPTISIAPPNLQEPIYPPPAPAPASNENRDMVMIAAAVAGGVGLLLLGLITVYCAFTRIRDDSEVEPGEKRLATGRPYAGYAGHTPVAAVPAAGLADARMLSHTSIGHSAAGTPSHPSCYEHNSHSAHPIEPAQRLWPPAASRPPLSPPHPTAYPGSPTPQSSSSMPTHTYPYAPCNPDSALAYDHRRPPHSGRPSHSPPPPSSIHPQASLPAPPGPPNPDHGRSKSYPSSAPPSYPLNVHPYNPPGALSRGGSERSSRGASNSGVPPGNLSSVGPPLVGSISVRALGMAARQSTHGHSGHSSTYEGPMPRGTDSPSTVPSPPSSYHTALLPTPPDRIKSRFSAQGPPLGKGTPSDGGVPQALANLLLSTLGSTGTGGGGGGSFSSNAGSVAPGHMRAGASSGSATTAGAPGGGALRPGSPAPSERGALEVPDPHAAASAGALLRKLGSPLSAARHRSLRDDAEEAQLQAAGGLAVVSDPTTNCGSTAAVDTSSRSMLNGGETDDADRGEAVAPCKKPAARERSAVSRNTDPQDIMTLTHDLDNSAAELDSRSVGDRRRMPLPDTLKPSSAKQVAAKEVGHGLAPGHANGESGKSRTGSDEHGPAEHSSAARYSSQPSSSLSMRGRPGACRDPAGNFVGTGPVSVSPPASNSQQSRGAHAALSPSRSVQRSMGRGERGGDPEALQTMEAGATPSSLAMRHVQLFEVLKPLGGATQLLGSYSLLGATRRRLSAQGVVQFAERTSPADTEVGSRRGEEVVMKFYLTHAAFDRVASLHSQSALARVTCAIVEVDQGGLCADRDGAEVALPPVVVTRRGMSLEEWAAQTKPAMPTLVAALGGICEQLSELHACGYVYYAVKPTNVAWFERERAWRLIDFGCAARAGVNAALSFSLSYAAPELVAMHDSGAQTARSHYSADIWALGLMAYELAVGRHTFPAGTHADKTRAAIHGSGCGAQRAPQLPWETPAGSEPLLMLRPSVLSCLARDPAARPSAYELAATWRKLLVCGSG